MGTDAEPHRGVFEPPVLTTFQSFAPLVINRTRGLRPSALGKPAISPPIPPAVLAPPAPTPIPPPVKTPAAPPVQTPVAPVVPPPPVAPATLLVAPPPVAPTAPPPPVATPPATAAPAPVPVAPAVARVATAPRRPATRPTITIEPAVELVQPIAGPDADDAPSDEPDVAAGTDASPAKRRGGWRRSAFGTLGTGTALIAGQAATGLALLILARRTTPSVFGAFVAVYGVSTAIGGLIDFGSSSRATIDLAQGADRLGFLPWLTKRTVWQLPMMVVLALVGLAYADSRLPVVCVLALSIQSVTIAVGHGTLGAVRVLRSPVLAEWIVFAGNMVTLVTVIVAPSAYLLTGMAIASAASWAVCAGIAVYLIRDKILPWKRTWIPGNPWRGAASFGFAGIAVVLQGFILVVVEHTSSTAQAGQLGAVQKWTQPISLIALAYSGYLFPSLAAAISDRVAIRLLRTVVAIFGVGVVASAVIIAIAPEMVRLLLGSEYVGSVHVLRLLIIVSLPELIMQPMSVLLQARGLDRTVAWTMMSLSIAGLAAIALLAPHIGNTAVPLVEGFSNAISLTVFGIGARRMWLRNKALVPRDETFEERIDEVLLAETAMT
ncbi:MAG: hypothetical protein JWM34_1186 [Ilumatobacteraceae bacterium]|nr:hypothetical protein [Ilumatobacteraceae bacterium]